MLFRSPRGADSLQEFIRQRDKIINAILTLDAQIIGLMELENDGYGPTSAIANLVNGLNAAGSGDYAFVNPGLPNLGGDEISVGLIYRTQVVQALGAAATLSAFPFNTLNRQPLVQTFKVISTGEVFTVVVNHFKSKLCSGATGGNADQGDGQGCWNVIRTQAAQTLANWLATDPTRSGDPDVLIIGDLNAYAKEDPIRTLEAAGYSNLIDIYLGTPAYSYIYYGQAGSLDHAFANISLTSKVAGATVWHINADEPRVLDYNL